MSVILAIDGGGSRTRCLAVNKAGRIVSEATSGPSNHLLVARDVVVHSLREAIDKALAGPSLRYGDVECVSAGLAGVDYDGVGADEMERLLSELGFEKIIVNGDMVIAHAGALAGRPGVVALSGTGSCILGIGPKGERVKVGGWGPIYGDEGSAYRIGQMALRAAAQAVDRRGPSTTLVTAIEEAMQLKSFQQTVQRVYVEGMEPREIAALSQVVNKVAEDGDTAAIEILRIAGAELAESALAALNQLDMGKAQSLVSYTGSVVQSCRIVRESFRMAIEAKEPEASLIAPRFEPVIGALLLGCEEVGWSPDNIGPI
jgi:N-acetylglucosamine kinase-like BadF-type ATPase